MVDELSRIEGIYGSVAEYNRAMLEEQQEEYEPTLEEQIKADNDMLVYHEKIRLLDGVPSDFINQVIQEWDEKKPKESEYKEYNDFIYAGYAYASRRTVDIVTRVCDFYHVSFDSEWKTFYRPGLGLFGISIEYTKGSSIMYLHIGALSYEDFKNVFRDLYFARLYPTMSYEATKDSPVILSNCSLGRLRISDLKLLGVETDEVINEELNSLGFDEQQLINSNTERWYSEMNLFN